MASALRRGHAGRAVPRGLWGEGLPTASGHGLQRQKVPIRAGSDQRRTLRKLDLARDVSGKLLCCWIQCSGNWKNRWMHILFSFKNNT